VDYRSLNAITVKNRYPTPLFDTLLNQVRDARFFNKLDLREAFHRLRIKSGDEWKTAFKTRYGLFEYKVMPFGLCNGPASFQGFIDHVLDGLIDNTLVAFFDDILIYGATREEVVKNTRECLQRFRDAGLFVKLSKCEFHATQVSFLGFLIGNGKIEMDPDRVQAIKEWPKPQKLKHVQEFLGFCNFYRRFIHGYSRITKGLTDLTRGKIKRWLWTPEAEKSFNDLKNAYCQFPVLYQFDSTKQIYVIPDASIYVVGGILAQPDDNGRLHPVAYYSRKLTPEESRYGTPDQELLAVVYSMEHWRHFLEGALKEVIVLSDHNNLRWFNSTTKLSRRQYGLWLKLTKFDYTIKHIPGQKNPADALSRRFDYTVQSTAEEPRPFLNFSATQITTAATSALLIAIRAVYEQALQDDNLAKELAESGLPDGSPWTQVGGQLRFADRLYIPESLRKDILFMCHDSPIAGHYGQKRTVELVKRDFYWPGMTTFIRSYVQGCHHCARNKHATNAPHGLLRPLPVPEHRWSRVGLDFITSLPPTAAGNDAILVMVDALTKRGKFEAVKFKGTDGVATAKLVRKRVFREHGLPKTFITDRGTQFVNSFNKSLCDRLQIDHFPTTAFHPQGDGQTERLNQPLEAYLRAYVNYFQDDWDEWLDTAEFAYNNSEHSTTKMSPFYADLGRHPNYTVTTESSGAAFGDEEANAYADKQREVLAVCKEACTRAAESMNRYYDLHRTDKSFNVGDQVWLDTRHIRTRRACKKLDQKYAGPYEILERIGLNAYRLNLPETLDIHRVFNVSLLRPVKDSVVTGQPEYPQGPLEVIPPDHEWEVKAIVDSSDDADTFYYKVA
jgi:hypothetical protein